MGQTYTKFKGTQYQYCRLHRWVDKQLGTPSLCENCLTTEAARYEWANISGEYIKDVSDWARLCKMCHYHIDFGGATDRKKPFCGKGHPMTGDNEKWSTPKIVNGVHVINRYCGECQKGHRRRWAEKNKLKKQLEAQL